MRSYVPLCMLLAGLAGASSAVNAQAPVSSDDRYAALLKLVLKGDGNVDYRAFRIAGARRLGSDASMIEVKERTTYKQLLASGDAAGALTAAEAFLDKDAANAIAQFDAMLAYQALKRPEDAAIHEKVLDKLMDSIQRSGDGKSPETAWFVVTTQEEYLLIRRVLGLTPKSQALVHDKGHIYDKLQAVDPKTGRTQDLWFNVDFDMGLCNEPA